MDIKSKFLVVLLAHLFFFPLVSCASLGKPKQETVVHKDYVKGEFKLGNSYHVNGKNTPLLLISITEKLGSLLGMGQNSKVERQQMVLFLQGTNIRQHTELFRCLVL